MIDLTPVFTGIGLNNMTARAPDVVISGSSYTIVIDHVGVTDSFKWKKAEGSWNENIAITGIWQTLVDEVQIKFATKTGHTLADQWVITTTMTGTEIWPKQFKDDRGSSCSTDDLKLRGIKLFSSDYNTSDIAIANISNLVIYKKEDGVYYTIEEDPPGVYNLIEHKKYIEKLYGFYYQNKLPSVGSPQKTVFQMDTLTGIIDWTYNLDYSDAYFTYDPVPVTHANANRDKFHPVDPILFIKDGKLYIVSIIRTFFYVPTHPIDTELESTDLMAITCLTMAGTLDSQNFDELYARGRGDADCPSPHNSNCNLYTSSALWGKLTLSGLLQCIDGKILCVLNAIFTGNAPGTEYTQIRITKTPGIAAVITRGLTWGNTIPNSFCSLENYFVMGKGATQGFEKTDFSWGTQWWKSGNFNFSRPVSWKHPVANDEYVYILDTSDVLYAYNSDGSLRWSENLSGYGLSSVGLGLVHTAIYTYHYELQGEDFYFPVIIITGYGHILSRCDGYAGPNVNWDCDSSGWNLYPCVDQDYIYSLNNANGYDIQKFIVTSKTGVIIESYAPTIYYPLNGAYQGRLVLGEHAAFMNTYGDDEEIWGLTSTLGPFYVESTDPSDTVLDILPTAQDVVITFNDMVDPSTFISGNCIVKDASLNILPWELTDTQNSTATFHMNNAFPIGIITIELTADIHNINGTALTIHNFSFTVSTDPLSDDDLNMIDTDEDGIPDEVTDLIVVGLSEPYETYYENTTVYFQPPSVKTPELAWLLQFRLKSYSDAAKTQLLECIDTESNPERFQISSDDVTWQRYPPEGLPAQEYSENRCIVKARILTGRGNKAYVVPFVAAEPLGV